MGTLFRKSFQLSQEVHGAMRSRGFDGEAKILDTFQIRARDYAWIFASLVLAGLLLWWDRHL